jgi:hypothetical protein
MLASHGGTSSTPKLMDEIREILGLAPSPALDTKLRYFLEAANGDLNVAINHYFSSDLGDPVVVVPAPPGTPLIAVS